jgi:hypothetical protein
VVATFGGSAEAHKDGIQLDSTPSMAGETEQREDGPRHAVRERWSEGEPCRAGETEGRESGAEEGEWAFSEKQGRGPQNEWDSWLKNGPDQKRPKQKKRLKFCLFIIIKYRIDDFNHMNLLHIGLIVIWEYHSKARSILRGTTTV